MPVLVVVGKIAVLVVVEPFRRISDGGCSSYEIVGDVIGKDCRSLATGPAGVCYYRHQAA